MADELTGAGLRTLTTLMTKLEETERKALEDQVATHDEEEFIRKRDTRDRRVEIKNTKEQKTLDQIVAENSEKIKQLTEQVRTETAAAKEAVEEVTEATEEQTKLQQDEADLLKLRGDRDKEKRDASKKEEMLFYQRLEGLGIEDADIQDDMLKDFNKGLAFEDEDLKLQYANQQLIQERTDQDAQIARDAEIREEERQATNLRAEASLSGMYETMGMAKETADRLAKKQMQMKESVHKWWEDKKSALKKTASSILEWILKGAGLFLLYKLFMFLSTTNLKEIYDTAVKAFEFLWQGFKTLGAWIGGIKVFKYVADFFKTNKGWLKFVDFWKGIGGKITKAFKDFKITKLLTKIVNLFKAGGKIFKLIFKAFGGGIVVKTWQGIINAIKGVFKFITAPFGKGGGIGKIFASITKFLTAIPGMGKIMGFVGKAAKLFAKLFAPVMLVWGIVEAIFAGWDEAEKEKGGLGAKIMAFMSGALKKLLDFFVFDLAQMVQDGIQWAIRWVMGLFGFSEEEQKAATDWDLVGAVRDALFKAIDWIKGLFKFDGKGVSFKELAPLIDIILFPLNAAFKWLSSIFGWDTDKDGKKKEDWSLGGLITGALDKIFAWFKDLLDFDFTSMLKSIPGYETVAKWFGGDSKEDLQKEMDELKEDMAKLGDRDDKSARIMRKELKRKASDVAKRMNKLATGGTILPGGAAIVGEGSMAGELVINAASTAKVIPAQQTADIMSGMGGGGQMFAPTTINSAPSSTTMIAASSSLNPISQKYFRN